MYVGSNIASTESDIVIINNTRVSQKFCNFLVTLGTIQVPEAFPGVMKYLAHLILSKCNSLDLPL